jgi:hypothetical protein
MIPPFTGNGMSMAFEGAETALGPLAAWSAGRLGWDDCRAAIRRGLRHRFARRLRVAGVLHPLLTSAAGRVVVAALGRAGLLPFRMLYLGLRGGGRLACCGPE